MRRVLLVVGLLVALLVAAVVASALLLDPAELRGPIASLVSERLRRPVEMGDLDLSLLPLPAVRVSDVRIGGRSPSAPPLAEIREIHLRPSLLALLFGEVVVRTLEVHSPRVHLDVDAQGLPVLPELGEPDASAETDSDAAALLIDRISVVDGSVEAGAWRVESLDLQGSLALDATASLSLQADLPGLALLRDVEVSVAGLLGDEIVADIAGRVVDADLAALAGRADAGLQVEGRASGPFAARVAGGALVAATLELGTAGFQLQSGELRVSGDVPLRAELGGPFRLDLADVEIQVADSLRKPLGDALSLEGTLPERLPVGRIEGLSLNAGDNRLPLDLDLAGGAVTLGSARVDVAPLAAWLVDPPEGLGGHLAIDSLVVRGAPLRIEGSARLDALTLALAEGTARVDGPVRATGNELIAEPLEVRLGDQTLPASARYDLARETVRTRIGAEGSDLGALQRALLGKRDVDGALSLTVEVRTDAALSRLGGEGSVRVTAGRIHGFSIAEQALGELTALSAALMQARGKDLAPYLEEEFDELTATFELRDHRLRTQDLVVLRRGTRTELRGEVDILTGELGLSGRLLILEELDAELSGTERGVERVIPIAGIGGTVNRPRVRLDRDALAHVAATYATGGRVRDALEERLGTEGAEAVEGLLEQLLKGGGGKR